MKNQKEIHFEQTATQPPAAPNCSAWQPTQQLVSEMRSRYGTAAQFLQTFSPDLQLQVARHAERAYFGTAPLLSVVAAGYGEQTAIVWLCIEAENMNNFVGVKEKMPVSRQKELAAILLAEYPALKVTEFLLFFHRLKCGRYGRFYGTVDALFITSALVQFMEERRTETARYKAARRKTEQSPAATAPSGRAITYDEYLLLKQQKEQSL